MSPTERSILDKLRDLSPDRVAEVEDFVDFLRLRAEDAALTRAAGVLSEGAFRAVWDNPDDAEYDRV